MSEVIADGPGLGHRQITFSRIEKGRFRATNARGGTLDFASGENTDFTPVELLLVAIAGCSAVDVDLITVKRAEPEHFEVTATGTKARDEQGNRLQDIAVHFAIDFPAKSGCGRFGWWSFAVLRYMKNGLSPLACSSM